MQRTGPILYLISVQLSYAAQSNINENCAFFCLKN